LKQILLISILTLFIAGCNLTSGANSSLATDTPPPTRTLPFATDSHTTQETSVPDTGEDSTTAPTPAASGDTPVPGILCVEQSDWFEYTVQRGDNLTNIANRTRSTVDELIEANCLDNPNRIRVGTTIYVPNEPE
jgi:LysM repeat protein